MNRHLLALLMVFILLIISVQPAAAHANPESSDPPAGALLQSAPKELVITFSEELDPHFSRIQLFNSANQIVNPGPGEIDPAAPRVMRLPLAALANDSYTASWRARSTVDGHVTEGSIPFGVGVASTASLLPAPGTPDPATAPPPILDSVIRWLAFALAAIAFGGVPFALFVWRPIVPTTARIDAHLALTGAIRRLIIGGSGLFLLSSMLYLLTQAASAADVSLLDAFGEPLLQMLGSQTGQLGIARMLLTLVVLALAWRLSSATAAWRWWTMLAAVGGVALTFSLNAHGAAEQQGALLAIVADWLHVVAMIAWLGGLIPLLAAINLARRSADGAPSLGALIRRFSWLAGTCVVLLTLTGLYSYVRHIERLDLLVATSYGRALLVKIGLFALLIGLGAINLLILSPKLRRSTTMIGRSFSQTVCAEAVIGALLLLAVGAMMSLAPSATAWEQHERQGVVETVTSDDVALTLRVAPARIGDNEWAVDVDDERPGAQQVPATVLFRYAMQGMAMGTLQTEAPLTTSQRYLTRGSFTSMGGRWNVEVILRRSGFNDVRHTFVVDLVRRQEQPEAATR